jgi:putative membrane protein
VVVVFGALFSVQNGSAVPLDLLVFQFSERSMAFWLLSAFAVGGLLGVAVSMLAIMRLKSSQLALRRQLGKHDKQLGQYDNTVVKD